MFEKILKLIRKYKRKNISLMNTYDILRPVKILTYITGFRVFEYPPGHSRPRLSFFYGMLLYSIYYTGWYYQGFLQKPNKVFNLEGALFQIAGDINQVAVFVILILGCYHSKSLKQSVRRIHEVDLTLGTLGSPRNFYTIYKRIIVIMIFVTFLLMVFIGLHIYVHVFLIPPSFGVIPIISSVVVYFFGQVVEHMLILEFCIVVRSIDLEFLRVNDLLGDMNILPFSSIAIELLGRKNLKDSCSRKKSSFETSTKLFTLLPASKRLRSDLQMTSHDIIRSRRVLQTIRQVHLELYRVSKRISMIYGMQTSIVMSMSILYTTYFIYSLYTLYQQESNGSYKLLFSIVVTCMLCVNNSMKIISMNYICDRTAQQAQRTNELIYTFYGQSTDFELQEEMEMFSLQMMHCRLTYSAAGLYSLNCKNIYACVGFIATYVVIMIQVANSIKEDVIVT